MIEVQRQETQLSLKQQLAQRRRDLNVTTDTIASEAALREKEILEDSLSKSRSLESSKLVSSMMQRRQVRKQNLDQSMGKSMRGDGAIPSIPTINVDDQDLDKSQLKPLSSSVNLSTSIRDRLKDRAKIQQDSAMQKEPARKLRGLRNRDLQTRFDIESEDSAPPEEKHSRDDEITEDHTDSTNQLSTSLRWKMLAKRGKIAEEPEEKIDEYSFFTKVYEPVGGHEKQPKKSALIIPEVDDTNFAQYDSLYVVTKPELPKHDASVRLFAPTSAPAETATLHGGAPCFLDDEGIYVGEPPGVNSSNWNKMEQRLIQTETGKKWFGIDGNMIVAPDPLKQISSRPMIDFDVDPTIQRTAKCISLSQTGKFIGESSVNQLSVSITQVQFSHHPLFSKEHVLVSQLRDLHVQYTSRQRHNLASHLGDRLQSLRNAVQELQYTLGAKPWDMSKPFNKDCVANLEDYSEEIRNVREMWDIECMKDKTMIRAILTVWKEIKNLRETQGFIATNAKILVYKEQTNFAKEDKEWQKQIKSTFEESKEEMMTEYDENMKIHYNEMAEWKMQAREIKKRMKASKSKEVITEEGEEATTGVLPPKPVAPAKPQTSSLLNEIQSNSVKCRKVPGDPILTIELTHTVTITPIEECPPIEQKRRKDILKSSCYGKLFYNNSEVTRSPNVNLTSDFTLNFGESVCLQVVHWPESIKFELWSISEKLSEIFLVIPPNDRHTGNAELESLEFSSSHKVTYPNSTAVGSGVPESVDGKILLTSGKLFGSTAWVKDASGKILAPVRHDIAATFGRADPIHAIGARSLNDMEKVIQWISEAKLDPNDPRNAPLLHLMNRTRKDAPGDTKYFRLDHLEKSTYFVSTEELENDRRFSLLSLRNQGVPEYKPMKMVPMYSSEVTHFEYAQTEKEEKVSLKEEGDVFEHHRAAVIRFMQEIQDKIASRSRKVRPMLELSDVVVEDQVPDISTLGRSIAKLLEPRHPLRPQRKERKKVTNQAVGITKVDLLVNVSQAQCLPIRSRTTASEQRMTLDPNTARSTIQLRPFVEVTFQRQSSVTHVADGPNPHWNQELVLPLNVINNEFSASNLREITDIVYFNVFDEIIVDILADDRLRDTNIHQRLERRWLGSFQIPFSTIYINSRIEGKFKLNVPSTLMGYNKDHGLLPHLMTSDMLLSQSSLTGHTDKTSYLTIFITVEPPLAPHPALREVFDTNEEPRLIRAAAAWELLYNGEHGSRSVRSLVTDVNGKSVFITRYIGPQNPPNELVPEDRNMRKSLVILQKVAKFVSLIPYYQDSIAFSGSCDIWATSELFLKMLAGDEEEHAILLCNYFLYMGIDSYIIKGIGIPEGETCYVLTKQLEGNVLWNPSTGDYHPQSRPYHSLVSVHFCFNNENIWANMQPYDDPGRLDFNFNNTKNWKTFFAGKESPKLSTVQVSRLDYIETNVSAIQTLESNLEKMLMDKIMEWRERHVTRWNRHCRVVMRQLLPQLEMGSLSEEDQVSAMSEIMSSHNVTGFPINMRYSDASTIIETVYSTNVHVAEDPTVEFALTVYIHPYANNVLSVWIYVGTLTKKY